MEGKNIVIECDMQRESDAAELAAELVRLKVDVIVYAARTATRAAKAATTTIPIVMAQVPILLAMVCRQSCSARREHHWIVQACPEISGKQLELLKETVPKLSRVGVLGATGTPSDKLIY